MFLVRYMVKFHVKRLIIELMVKKISKVLTMLENSVNSLKKQNNRSGSTIIICGLLRYRNIVCNDENVSRETLILSNKSIKYFME